MTNMNQYLVAYGGEYARIDADNEAEALATAQADYEKGCGRVEDWKDSEHKDCTWDVIKLDF